MASRLELIFARSTKVQAAARYLCRVANIQRVERPVRGYSLSLPGATENQRERRATPTPRDPSRDRAMSTAPSYVPDRWHTMTKWKDALSSDDKPPFADFREVRLTNIAVLDSGIDLNSHPCLENEKGEKRSIRQACSRTAIRMSTGMERTSRRSFVGAKEISF